MTVLVITSSMPCEVSLAALTSFMGSDFLIVPMQSMSNIEQIKLDIITKIHSFPLSKNRPFQQRLLFIGSYWDKTMLEDLSRTVKIDQYNFPETPTADDAFAKKPHFFVANYVALNGIQFKDIPVSFIQSTLKSHERFFTLLDQRYNSENVNETEQLFSGLYVPITKDLNETPPAMQVLFDNVLQVLQQRLALDDVLKTGRSIVDMRMNLAHERVLNNSSVRTLANGQKVVIVNAPDLINVTHDALHKKYPDVPLTTTVALQLKNDKVELSLSLRTYGGETSPSSLDLKKLVNDINTKVALWSSQKNEAIGMANENVGGGRIEFPQLLRMLQDVDFLAKQ